MTRENIIRWALVIGALGGAACGGYPEAEPVTPPEGTEAEQPDGVAQEAQPLSVGGMTVTWKLVGTPSQASQIAACMDGATDVVYALNNDYRLYRGNGTNAGWSYRGYPSAARDIACTQSSSNWIWAFNTDKKFYFNVYGGADASWTYEGTAPGAVQIGNASLLSALNGDGSVWTYDNATKVWTHRATFAGATQASAARVGGSGAFRWFVVKGGDVHFTNGATTALTAFPVPGMVLGSKLKVRDVSSPRSDVVWALTESRRLYKAVFTETACKDGKDNDVDAMADGFEWDCVPSLAKEVCAKFNKTGNFCVSRLGIPSNALAQCTGSTLTAYKVGDWCTQVGAGGADTIGFVH